MCLVTPLLDAGEALRLQGTIRRQSIGRNGLVESDKLWQFDVAKAMLDVRWRIAIEPFSNPGSSNSGLSSETWYDGIQIYQRVTIPLPSNVRDNALARMATNHSYRGVANEHITVFPTHYPPNDLFGTQVLWLVFCAKDFLTGAGDSEVPDFLAADAPTEQFTLPTLRLSGSFWEDTASSPVKDLYILNTGKYVQRDANGRRVLVHYPSPFDKGFLWAHLNTWEPLRVLDLIVPKHGEMVELVPMLKSGTTNNLRPIVRAEFTVETVRSESFSIPNLGWSGIPGTATIVRDYRSRQSNNEPVHYVTTNHLLAPDSLAFAKVKEKNEQFALLRLRFEREPLLTRIVLVIILAALAMVPLALWRRSNATRRQNNSPKVT